MDNRRGVPVYTDNDPTAKNEDLYSSLKKEYTGMEPPSIGTDYIQDTKPRNVHYFLNQIMWAIIQWFRGIYESIAGSERFVDHATASKGEAVGQRKIIGGWLLGCAAMLLTAGTLSGVTRLAGSSATVVDWNLIKRVKPWSLTDTQWRLDYLHRMLGCALGLAFFIPCAYFWARGRFNAPMKKCMVSAAALLIVQGLLGWWMVESELDPSQETPWHVPRASQYSLIANLISASLLFVIFLWTGLSHAFTPHDHSNVPNINRLRGIAFGTAAVVYFTSIVGAFVAGLNAGRVCNTWPTYDGQWIPDGMLAEKPIWRNLFENPVTVQFFHRLWAYLSATLVVATWLVGWRMALSPRAKMALHGLMITGCSQAVLGILTLIYRVPVWLGAVHQSVAVAIVGFAFWLTYELQQIPK